MNQYNQINHSNFQQPLSGRSHDRNSQILFQLPVIPDDDSGFIRSPTILQIKNNQSIILGPHQVGQMGCTTQRKDLNNEEKKEIGDFEKKNDSQVIERQRSRKQVNQYKKYFQDNFKSHIWEWIKDKKKHFVDNSIKKLCLNFHSEFEKTLSNQQKKLIEDYYNVDLKKGIQLIIIIIKIQERNKPILSNQCLFEMNSYFVVAFNLLNISFILFSIFWYPFMLSFFYNDEKTYEQLFDISMMIIIVIDILISINVPYINKGMIITDRIKIIKNYLYGNSLIDIVIINQLSYFRLNFLFKFYSLREQQSIQKLKFLQQYYQFIWLYVHINCIKNTLIYLSNHSQNIILRYFNIHGELKEFLNLINLAISILLIGHLFACLWHAVAVIQIDSHHTWLHDQNLINSSYLSKYNYAYYWAAMTMITVGYGDIIPQNDLEVLCCSITMFLACGVFGYSINSIGQMLDNINSKYSEYKQQQLNNEKQIRRIQAMLNHFFNINEVKLNLQQRIKNYYDYMWKEESNINDNEIKQTVFNKLPKSLQNELQYELRKDLINKSNFFSKFNQKIQQEIAIELEEIRYSPEDIILSPDLADDCAIFFIIRGEVDIKPSLNMEKSLKLIKVFYFHSLLTLQKGEAFGEYSFFTGFSRQTAAVAKDFTKVLKLNRANFLKIIQNSNEDFELFHYLKDQIIYSKNYQQLKTKCYICNSNQHLVKDCNSVHLVKSQEFVLKKYLFPYYQQRKKFDYRVKKYFQTLKKCAQVSSDIKQILQKKQSSIENFEDDEPEGFLESVGSNSLILQQVSRSLTKLSKQSMPRSQNNIESNPEEINLQQDQNIEEISHEINQQRKNVQRQSYRTAGNTYQIKTFFLGFNSMNFDQPNYRQSLKDSIDFDSNNIGEDSSFMRKQKKMSTQLVKNNTQTSNNSLSFQFQTSQLPSQNSFGQAGNIQNQSQSQESSEDQNFESQNLEFIIRKNNNRKDSPITRNNTKTSQLSKKTTMKQDQSYSNPVSVSQDYVKNNNNNKIQALIEYRPHGL